MDIYQARGIQEREGGMNRTIELLPKLYSEAYVQCKCQMYNIELQESQKKSLDPTFCLVFDSLRRKSNEKTK